jgi:glutamate-1-semialdehyde aminotransferase
MATDLELAVLANAVYVAHPNNSVLTPSWKPVDALARSHPSGFAAQVFEKGNEVVIAFRGTDDPKFADFLNGNIPAGAGHYSDQVWEAIMLVADAQAKHGVGAMRRAA